MKIKHLDLNVDFAAQAEERYAEREEQNAEDRAAEKGCYVESSDDYTLQMDIDSQEDLEFFWQQFHRLSAVDHPIIAQVADNPLVRRSSGGNWHVTVKVVEPLSVEKRILLQCLLGSDRIREMFNYQRVCWGSPNPIRLFRPLAEKPSDVD